MPRKKDPLRALSRKTPAPEEIESILKLLPDQPDRIAAIVGASIVEAYLESAIKRHLKITNATLNGQLFLNRGPASDLNSKIILAEAIGLIPNATAVELHRIRTIRNVFAHTSLNVMFDTAEIANELDDCELIGVLEGSMDFVEGKVVRSPRPERLKLYKMSKKQKFTFLIKAACHVLLKEEESNA